MSHSSNTSNGSPARGMRRWIIAYVAILCAFTVFVLLDTFVIGRAQANAQAMDTSSIVQTQSALVSTSSQAGNGTTAGSSEATSASTADTSASASTSASSSSSSGSSSSASASSSRSRASSSSAPSGISRNRSSSSSASSSAGSRSTTAATTSRSTQTTTALESTGLAYSDENMQIAISSQEIDGTTVYVADVRLSSALYLKTALANGTYGRNIKQTTSDMAQDNDAVLAINGDYYGFRDYGYVIRNGILYRATPAENTDCLIIYGDGSMASADQSTVSAQELLEDGAWQVLSFGPTLVDDGKIVVDGNDEVSRAKSSNPRTAIGMIDPLHYIVVVSDGRTSDDAGLSLYDLATIFADEGCTFAYNLDGGGSTTLWFQGEVLNVPTSGNASGERSVSDIVYFG